MGQKLEFTACLLKEQKYKYLKLHKNTIPGFPQVRQGLEEHPLRMSSGNSQQTEEPHDTWGKAGVSPTHLGVPIRS